MYTYHSIQRANERTRYSGKAAVRFIKNGIQRGKTAADFFQSEREYLTNCTSGNCIAKVYNGFCLIVSEYGDCITIYRLPEWFGKKRHYDKKTRVRNVKRFAACTATI